MFHRLKTDYMGWIFLIGTVLLIMELVLSGGGLLFSLAFSIGCIFLGKKFYKRILGKVLLIIGIFSTLAIILNMMVFRFFLLVILAYLLLIYYQSKKSPKWIKPILVEPAESQQECVLEPLVKVDCLWKNQWFGNQKTIDAVYEWNNVNIQNGIGNTVIDLSQTILPKSDVVISIRCLVGNTKILIPYGVEVSIHHSVIAGRTKIFNHQGDEQWFNQVLFYKTPDFNETQPRVHITTAVIIGDLEVRRV